MTRRTRTLRAAIAMATVGLLLAGCSDEADSVDPLTEGSASQAVDPTLAQETSPATDETGLPNGLLALPEAESDGAATAVEGRYRIPLSAGLSYDIDLPQGTEANGGGLYLVAEKSIVKVEAAGEEYGVPTDPCTGIDGMAPVGDTVDNLIAAIRTEPIYKARAISPVEFGDVTGVYLRLHIPPDFDASSCTDRQIGLPGNPGTSNNMAPGYAGHWWVLDVDGQRVVAQTYCDRCDMDQFLVGMRMVQSITFARAS